MNEDTDSNDNERSTYGAAADLGAIKLDMYRERKSYGEYARRMAELRKLAAVKERVLERLLDNSLEKAELQKKPHLTVVK